VARAEQSALCRGASPADCFAAVADFESYPEWQSAVRSAEVLSRDDAVAVVAFGIDARVKKVNYTLRYHLDEGPARISWDFVDGDVDDVAGEYVFEAQDGGTLATYRLEIDVGRFLPGPLRKVLTDTVMKQSVLQLAQRVGSDS
jgi:ribosome-associated toxin RatA of RatAB toxin-antitoxin module